MPGEETVVDLRSSVELTSSLMEQLRNAFLGLEGCEDVHIDNLQWEDIEVHFHHLKSEAMRKLEEVETKEKEFRKMESLLAERENSVIAMEQDLIDRVQELKDAAVAAITDAKENCPVHNDGGYSPSKLEVAGSAIGELKGICERMDSKGLLEYVIRVQNFENLNAGFRRLLFLALGSAAEPARLVLDALEDFFPPAGIDVPPGMRQSCIVLIEALFAFLEARVESSAYNESLNPEMKQHAKAVADDWQPKLALDSIDAANGKSLEARAFLWLLVTFKVGSEFDEEYLCKCVLAVAHHKRATILCRSLGLTDKVPGMVEILIEKERKLEAAYFVFSFQLSTTFPPVPLLKTYLKEVRRTLRGNGDPNVQKLIHEREYAAVKAVVWCVEKYKLETEFPLDQLRNRLLQLRNTVMDNRRDSRRIRKENFKFRQGKINRPRPGVNHPGVRDQGQPPFSRMRTAHTELEETYPNATLSAHGYPVLSQSQYTAQADSRGNIDCTVSGQPTQFALADQHQYNYPVDHGLINAAQVRDQTSYNYSVPSLSRQGSATNDQQSYSYHVPGQPMLAAHNTNDDGNYSYAVPNQTYNYAQGNGVPAPSSVEPHAYGGYMQPSQQPFI